MSLEDCSARIFKYTSNTPQNINKVAPGTVEILIDPIG